MVESVIAGCHNKHDKFKIFFLPRIMHCQEWLWVLCLHPNRTRPLDSEPLWYKKQKQENPIFKFLFLGNCLEKFCLEKQY